MKLGGIVHPVGNVGVEPAVKLEPRRSGCGWILAPSLRFLQSIDVSVLGAASETGLDLKLV